VAQLLQAKGAVVIDADVLGHQVLEAGSPSFASIVDVFGDAILSKDGKIDRAKLGEIVFGDPDKRKQLEAISHPRILEEITQRVDELRDTDQVVVLDAALLVEIVPDRGRSIGLDALVVVSSFPEEQLERMISLRGMSERDAGARIASQGPLEKKLAVADYVIHNRGSLDELGKAVDLFWDDAVSGGVRSSQWGAVEDSRKVTDR